MRTDTDSRVKGGVTFLSLAVVLAMSLAACLLSEKEDRRTGPEMELAKLAEYHCEPMKAWIARNKDNLPATYDEVIRFPPQCRRLLYIELSPAVQSSLWRTQIERYRARHPSLDAEQEALLDRAIQVISPASCALSPDSPE